MTVIKDSECNRDSPLTFGYPDKPVYGFGKAIRPRYSGKQETEYDKKIYLPELLPLEEYDLIIVLLSGGKDSVAAYLKLLELGVPKEKIELWHHDIDGGHPDRRMDWPVTQNYVRAFAAAEGVKLRTSCRVNGFFGELYRVGASYPIEYEDNGEIKTCRLTPAQVESDRLRRELLQELLPEDRQALEAYGHRARFPAKSGDLSRRWCSAYLKIDVAKAVITNLEKLQAIGKREKLPAKGSIENGRYCSPSLKREVGDSVLRVMTAMTDIGQRGKFPAKSGCHQGRWCSGTLKAEVQSGVTTNLMQTRSDTKILVVSGERRGESAGRSKYNEMEIHRTNATARAHRLVHQWRAVIDYSLRDVWELLRRHNVTPHPCYSVGWGRCSCACCIFSLPSHWAGIRELFPDIYEAFRQDEIRLGFTLDNKKTLDEYVGDAKSCVYPGDQKALHQLVTGQFSQTDIYQDGEWKFPAGAFKGSDGGPC